MKMRLRNPRTNTFMEFHTSDEMVLEEVHNDPPEPHWQDVTGECIVNVQGILVHNDKANHEITMAYGNDNYRLRKVHLRATEDETIAGMLHTSMQWAFIIERKVE